MSRVFLGAEPDLLSHFAHLARQNDLPSFETLLYHANTLVNRYASQDAYEQALSLAESNDASTFMKVPVGQPTTMPIVINIATESDPSALPTEDLPKVHQEAKDFDGDRVLANSILFLQDFGWWTEIAYAVPDGDIGRVFEILKVSTIPFRFPLHCSVARLVDGVLDLDIRLCRVISSELYDLPSRSILPPTLRGVSGSL